MCVIIKNNANREPTDDVADGIDRSERFGISMLGLGKRMG